MSRPTRGPDEGCRVRGCHPSCQAFQPVPLSTSCGHWPDPRSLATTDGVSLMSFPRGTEMFQFPRFAFGTYGFSSKYLHGPSSIPALPRPSLARRTRRPRMAKVEGGFPHSEIQGSKPVRGSPRLIAAYHVLHRLSAPRHPPDTLMTLDHSHHRCPPGSGDPCPAGQGPSTLGTPIAGCPGPPTGGPKTFASERVRGEGRSRLPVTAPASRGPSHDGKASRASRPVGSGRFGKLRLPRGRTLGSDTFTLHDVEQHARPEGRAMRQPDGPAANSL